VAKTNKTPVRLKDIAVKAALSIGTVDRVLHNRGRVSEESKKKVNEAIAALEYKPNMIARGLATSKSYHIAIIVQEYHNDSYWESLINGVNQAYDNIKAFGFSIDIIVFDPSKKGDLLRYKKTLANGNYSALLLAPTLRDDAHEVLNLCDKMNIPYVLINTNISRLSEGCLSFVGHDSYQSGGLAAKLFSLMTAKNDGLAILHMEKEVDHSMHMIQKQEGFKNFFNSGQHEPRNLIIDRVSFNKDKIDIHNSLKKLLTEHKSLKGIFVTTSRAHLLAEALRSLDRDDLLIVGYDLIAENLVALDNYERLILINQNPERQGYEGLFTLFDHLFRKRQIVLNQLLPMDVVTKENISNYINVNRFSSVSI